MVRKYVRLLEEREINHNTESIWCLNDVPNTWREKVKQKILEDGYSFNNDGTIEKTLA